MSTENNFLYEELSYEVTGCAYEAFKTVGVGFDEISYHKVFHHSLLQAGLKASYKPPIHLDYLGEKIAEFEIDEIVEDKLIVELKAIRTNFIPENYAQVLTYLKITGLKIGLLINFGLHKAFVKRVIFDEQRQRDFESWDKGYFQDSSSSKLVENIISLVRHIDKELGVGYHSKIYKMALSIELKRNKLAYDDNVCVDLKFEDLQLAPFEIDYWFIEKSILLGILAGQTKPGPYDRYRMRSYLKKLNLHRGLIVYWSTKNLQFFGIFEP